MSNYDFQNLRNTENNNDNKKLFLVIGISMLFLTIWQIFTSPNEADLKKYEEQKKIEKYQNKTSKNTLQQNNTNNTTTIIKKREKKEVFLNNDHIHIGFDTANNRISFLSLKDYKQHEKSLKKVILLDDDHFIENGWLGTYSNSEIVWKLGEQTKNSVSIIGQKNGLQYKTIYSIDDNYGIKIKQQITNKSGQNITISNYSRASLQDTTDRIENSYAFRGVILMNDNKINEFSYDTIQKQNIEKRTNQKGWIGISDQYWITAIISNNKENTTYTSRYNKEKNIYQIDFNSDEKILKNNSSLEIETMAFVAPKKLEILQKFGEQYNVEKIDKAIDFGMFYFISKPLLIILKRLFSITGNFGVAIILLTILVRMIIFPLANRSYKAMAKMKKIQPKMKELQEKYKDDKKALQMEIYKLYKEQNINPMSSIVPLLFQIPIFFALYKVLVISIEMRDAPFFGWIVDLSTKDPSSIFNLFGLLNFEVPYALQIGVLPLIMGFTMWLQQRLQPMTGADPTQQKIFKWMPVIFTFMFASMPAGLVLYWSCSNVFTIIQQAIITKKLNKEY